MINSSSIQGRLIAVTGGAQGIGKAICDSLARAGALVLATSRRCPTFPKNSLSPGSISPVPLDVTSEQSVLTLFNWIDSLETPLYGLVNNAGVGTFKPIVDLSLAEFEETLKTNLTGSFLCMREAARRMKSKGGGRIIQIGSISDHLTLPENGAYAASKFGTRALVGVLNEELKHHGVHCSLVSPGATLTEIWQGRSGFDPNDMISPDDIATTVTDILMRPKGVRIDEVKILPSKGVL